MNFFKKLFKPKTSEIDVEATKTFHCTYIKKDDHAFERLEEVINEI